MKKLLPILIALLQACAVADPAPVRVEIPLEVERYVNDFREAGKSRGKTIVLDNLIIELTSPVQSGGRHVCASTWGLVTAAPQNLIQIDTQCNAWRYGGVGREILVFHELGHALLQRRHKDGRFASGPLKSLMATDWNIGDFYEFDANKRPYYLDELFDENTPKPSWAE